MSDYQGIDHHNPFSKARPGAFTDQASCNASGFAIAGNGDRKTPLAPARGAAGKRSRPTWFDILRSLVLAACLLPAANTLAGDIAEAIFFVDAAAEGDGSGVDWANAFSELQPALDTALTGDQIWVACATYVPTELSNADLPRSASFNFRTGVSVFGGFAGGEESLEERNADPETNGCFLGDPFVLGNVLENQVTKGALFEGFTRILRINNVDDRVAIDGFTVIGDSNDGGPRSAGADFENATVTLRNMRFTGTQTAGGSGGFFGGAVFSKSSNLLVEDVTVDRCFSGRGGAFAVNAGTMTANRLTVSECASGFGGGGGVFPRSGATVEISDSTFVNNRGNNQGGAIVTLGSGPLTIRRSVFRDNTSSAGGAISHPSSSALVIENSVFVGNRSAGNGGGAIEVRGSGTTTLTNTTLAFNETSGLGTAIIARSSSTVVLNNAVVWGNFLTGSTAKGLDNTNPLVVDGASASITARFSLIELGFPGEGNLDLDPQFTENPNPGDGTWATDEDNSFGNLRILEASPAIDAGDNGAMIDFTDAMLETAADLPLDADRLNRLTNNRNVPDTGIGGPPVVDMGAFEFPVPVDTFEIGFKDGFEEEMITK